MYTINQDKPIMRQPGSVKGLLEMIQQIGDTKNKTMIEIGSFIGESTIIFAEHFKEVIAIDPFLPDYDSNDPTSNFNFDEVYEEYLRRTSPYKNIKTIRATSDDAIKELNGKTYDFVYIDGLHTYDGVKTDIINYQPLIKSGGVIGGHDYTDQLPHLIGVFEAVNEMFNKPDKIFRDNSWIKKL